MKFLSFSKDSITNNTESGPNRREKQKEIK
jgi:hypothetical protein